MSRFTWVVGGVVALTAWWASAAGAASVNWAAPVTISGDADVSTAGALDRAFNFGSTSAVTVNGVTFAAFNTNNGANPTVVGNTTLVAGGFTGPDGTATGYAATTATANPWNGLSANYKSLLQSGSYEDQQSLVLTFNGLAPGQAYAVQLWLNDSRSGPTATGTQHARGGSNTVILDVNSTDGDGGVGQFAVGTFTADATSQQINLVNAAAPQINAAQLRQVPEPASAGLLAVAAAAGLLARRRVRR